MIQSYLPCKIINPRLRIQNSAICIANKIFVAKITERVGIVILGADLNGNCPPKLPWLNRGALGYFEEVYFINAFRTPAL